MLNTSDTMQKMSSLDAAKPTSTTAGRPKIDVESGEDVRIGGRSVETALKNIFSLSFAGVLHEDNLTFVQKMLSDRFSSAKTLIQIGKEEFRIITNTLAFYSLALSKQNMMDFRDIYFYSLNSPNLIDQDLYAAYAAFQVAPLVNVGQQKSTGSSKSDLIDVFSDISNMLVVVSLEKQQVLDKPKEESKSSSDTPKAGTDLAQSSTLVSSAVSMSSTTSQTSASDKPSKSDDNKCLV